METLVGIAAIIGMSAEVLKGIAKVILAVKSKDHRK